MMFRSTRHKSVPVTALEAIEKGLADDGGLFVPVKFPQIDHRQFKNLDLVSIAERLLKEFIVGEVLETKLGEICREAFNFPAPLKRVDEKLFLLELFHGPTAAFKDFGARFLAGVFRAADKNAIVLVATSGDTGGAVASAFDGQEGIDVFILFPEKGVSPRQRHQLTCWGQNIHSYSVQGTFDDCQALVKQAFLDWKGARPLTSANSINVGRLLPQTVYYASSSLEFFEKLAKPAHFIIPTGNLGSAVAAVWARKLGFPIGRITLACNANFALPNYFKTGKWEPQPSRVTLANAMDVGNPSNWERLLDLYPNPREKSAAIDAHMTDDENIRRVIASAYKKWGLVICPHTATAVDAYQSHQRGPAVVVATAHPAKFEKIVEPLIGKSIEVPQSLRAIESKKEHFSVVKVSSEHLMSVLKVKDQQSPPR